ncbi:MAG TPA: hypothetical protein VK978_01205 [Candidatus Saccharimonadales bacterium]|nr:hypothetical protein [Candidatus Saccharimonadales bacterium]
MAAGIVVSTTASCGGYGEGPGGNVRIEGEVAPDADITSADCRIATDVRYPSASPTPVPTDPAARQKAVIDGMYITIQEADKAAVDNELPEAAALYQSIKRTSVGIPEAAWLHDQANLFLANQEASQLGLKAECAAYAGEITTAESMLERIENPAIRATHEDTVETWEGHHAADLAQDEQIDAAYQVLDFIDESGRTVRLEEQDSVENWVGFYAAQHAQDDPDAIPVALKLVDRIDAAGNVTRVEERDAVENWIDFHARQSALDKEHAKAAELAGLADDSGEHTKATILANVDRIIN